VLGGFGDILETGLSLQKALTCFASVDFDRRLPPFEPNMQVVFMIRGVIACVPDFAGRPLQLGRIRLKGFALSLGTA
jgi:hypothetical protein